VLCPLPAQRQVMRGEARLAYALLNAKRGVTVGVQGLRGASLFKCCVAPSLLLGYERLQGGTMRKPPCDHEWVVDYDPGADAACYNDGLNYLPAEYICTRCGKRKRIKYEDGAKANWVAVLLFPVIIVGLILAPIIIVIGGIVEQLAPKRRG
jgi:hypothetical protein